MSRSTQNRILVVVELSGGNDGLNTVVRLRDPAYYRAPAEAGNSGARVLRPPMLRLPPVDGRLRATLQRRSLAVVPRLRLRPSALSHFSSMGFWHTGVPNGWRAARLAGPTGRRNLPRSQSQCDREPGTSQSLAVPAANTRRSSSTTRALSAGRYRRRETPLAVMSRPNDHEPGARVSRLDAQ